MRPRAVLQAHEARAGEPQPVVGNRAERAAQPGGLRREPRDDRHHQHGRRHARVGQGARRAQPLQRRRGAGLERLPGVLVHGRHAQVDRALDGARQVGEQVPVAHDHRALRDDPDRRAAVQQRGERSARELVVPLDRLVRIGRGAQRDRLAGPRRARELPREDLREVRLHEHDAREVVAGPQLELRLVPAGVAVVAGVRAAPVRVERPREGHALHAVEGRPAGDLLIAHVVGPLDGARQALDAALAHGQRHVAGRRPPGRRGLELPQEHRLAHE